MSSIIASEHKTTADQSKHQLRATKRVQKKIGETQQMQIVN